MKSSIDWFLTTVEANTEETSIVQQFELLFHHRITVTFVVEDNKQVLFFKPLFFFMNYQGT